MSKQCQLIFICFNLQGCIEAYYEYFSKKFQNMIFLYQAGCHQPKVEIDVVMYEISTKVGEDPQTCLPLSIMAVSNQHKRFRCFCRVVKAVCLINKTESEHKCIEDKCSVSFQLQKSFSDKIVSSIVSSLNNIKMQHKVIGAVRVVILVFSSLLPWIYYFLL